MKAVTVSAPGKLMLLGEHAVVYNRPCLVTAVGQRMRATVTLLDSLEFQLEASDVQVTNYKKLLSDLGNGEIPRGAKFVEIAIKNFNDKFPLKGGVRVETASEFSSKLGFGSSSASTVCVIKALAELTGNKLNNKEIFDLAYKTVLDIQGKGSGFDVAAAIYGGTLYFETGGKVIEPLDIDGLPLVIGYSGVKADTVTLMGQVSELARKDPGLVEDIYDQMQELVEKAKAALLEKNWAKLGDLMTEDQRLLKKLGVSTDKLDSMTSAACSAGAYGAKLSGAGGGDCMIALTPHNKMQDTSYKIQEAGGEVINIQTNVQGARIEN